MRRKIFIPHPIAAVGFRLGYGSVIKWLLHKQYTWSQNFSNIKVFSEFIAKIKK